MRYLLGVGALAIIGFVAWVYPPDTPAAEPLVSHGFIGFVAGWTLLLIPASLTLVVITGCAVWLGSTYAKIAKAQRTKWSKQVSVSYSPHHRSFPAAAALPVPQPTIDVTPAVDVPSFAQLLDRGVIAPDRPLVLGYTPTAC